MGGKENEEGEEGMGREWLGGRGRKEGILGREEREERRTEEQKSIV